MVVLMKITNVPVNHTAREKETQGSVQKGENILSAWSLADGFQFVHRDYAPSDFVKDYFIPCT